LTVRKTRRKTLVTLPIGAMRVKELVKACARDGTVCGSGQLRSLSPARGTFGFDILVYVGEALFRRQRSVTEVMAELRSRNVGLSDREVGYLGRKFVIYLALAHRAGLDRLNGAMRRRGGYILHIDGTCEGDSPMLFTGLDELMPVVLDNIKIPSERADLLVPFLAGIKQRHGNPVALVHDMGRGILAAVAAVFPGVPDFICHYHFLRDVGKDLLEEDYVLIRNLLRKHKARALLRQKLKSVGQTDGEKGPFPNWAALAQAGGESPAQACQALIQWVLDYPAELAGYGFPFDRPQLSLYQRMKTACALMAATARPRQTKRPALSTVPRHLFNLLQTVVADPVVAAAVRRLEEKAVAFDRLRRALSIALPEGDDGLNDDGGEPDLKTVAQRVKEFRQWLEENKDLTKEKEYGQMLGQIDKYWDKLFADPIRVETPDGPIWLQPQRTNNILEQFFRGVKRGNRRRTGTASLTKTLRALLADTPLVKNLDNKEYLEILLDGSLSLAARFARIDEQEAQKELQKTRQTADRIPPALKKLIRRPDFIQKIRDSFAALSN
jgi:hypothetical protein